MFAPGPMPNQRPINTATVRAAHPWCRARETACPDHDDIFALADECDRLTEKVFSYELTLDTLSKQIGELGPALKTLFNLRILHTVTLNPATGTARVCHGCHEAWPCKSIQLLGEK